MYGHPLVVCPTDSSTASAVAQVVDCSRETNSRLRISPGPTAGASSSTTTVRGRSPGCLAWSFLAPASAADARRDVSSVVVVAAWRWMEKGNDRNIGEVLALR